MRQGALKDDRDALKGVGAPLKGDAKGIKWESVKI